MILRICLALFLLSLNATGMLAGKEETLQQLLTRAQSAKPQDQVGLYLEAAHRQLAAADQLYIEGKVDQAQAAVDDVVKFSEKAAAATVQSHKKLTNTEIDIRKMSQKLIAIKRTLNFDDQPPVQAAADKLEKLRTDLLSTMFKKEGR